MKPRSNSVSSIFLRNRNISWLFCGSPVYPKCWAYWMEYDLVVLLTNTLEIALCTIAWCNKSTVMNQYHRISNFSKSKQRTLRYIRSQLPRDNGESLSKWTDIPPALWPITVTRFGSPPKDSMFRWTHLSATVWSRKPILPLHSGIPRLRKPWSTHYILSERSR